MKNFKWLFMIMISAWSFTAPVSCKNKNKDATTQENKDAPVVISPDNELRTSVNAVVSTYTGVQAEVKDGVVTLRGSIAKDRLQNLIMALQELKPKKIENELVIQ